MKRVTSKRNITSVCPVKILYVQCHALLQLSRKLDPDTIVSGTSIIINLYCETPGVQFIILYNIKILSLLQISYIKYLITKSVYLPL